MNTVKYGFTMVELVFVIVILGILAAVAVPRLAATRTDAEISKAIADVAAIRSAIISERQSRLILGDNNWITTLHSGTNSYFDGNGSSSLLMYGKKPKDANGHWYGASTSSGAITYKYKLENLDNLFAYNPTNASINVSGVTVIPGAFICISGNICSLID